ncbi:MAG: rod shape-determining protein MreC [Candidatus Yanofskybacteria bacterium]|nr:rod shape-determining protein MreC [Candidatus Yanofskybacteria bacterium]
MQKSFLKKILLALAILVLLVFLNNYATNQFFKSFLVQALKPFLIKTYASLNSFQFRLVSWFRIDNIILENQFLSQQNRQLFSKTLKMEELEKENEFLRKELGVSQRRKWQIEIASIFQLNTSGAFRTAFVDKGSNQGIKSGMAVVFGGEILVGVIKEVFPDSSMILLVTDPRLTVSVKSKEAEVSARAVGSLDQGLFLELVANQENVKTGDLFLTSGLDSLSSALVVGRVASIKSDDRGLFKTVRLEPEFQNILPESVFIIK